MRHLHKELQLIHLRLSLLHGLVGAQLAQLQVMHKRRDCMDAAHLLLRVPQHPLSAGLLLLQLLAVLPQPLHLLAPVRTDVGDEDLMQAIELEIQSENISR